MANEWPVVSGAGMLGHMREFQRDPVALLQRFNAECGDVGCFKFPGATLVVVNTPELVGELLVDHAAKFRKSRVLRSALYPLVGDGLFTSDAAASRPARAGRRPGRGSRPARGHVPAPGRRADARPPAGRDSRGRVIGRRAWP